jgi:hypothetical protein
MGNADLFREGGPKTPNASYALSRGRGRAIALGGLKQSTFCMVHRKTMITMGSPAFVWINTNEIISSWHLLGAGCVSPPIAPGAPCWATRAGLAGGARSFSPTPFSFTWRIPTSHTVLLPHLVLDLYVENPYSDRTCRCRTAARGPAARRAAAARVGGVRAVGAQQRHCPGPETAVLGG